MFSQVKKLKELIEADRGSDFPATDQKLIYAGWSVYNRVDSTGLLEWCLIIHTVPIESIIIVMADYHIGVMEYILTIGSQFK